MLNAGTRQFSKYTAVYALTEPEKKSKGLACFIVDRENTAGVRTGKIENKMGIRSAQVSEVIFENCRVPAFNKVAQSAHKRPYILQEVHWY